MDIIQIGALLKGSRKSCGALPMSAEVISWHQAMKNVAPNRNLRKTHLPVLSKPCGKHRSTAGLAKAALAVGGNIWLRYTVDPGTDGAQSL